MHWISAFGVQAPAHPTEAAAGRAGTARTASHGQAAPPPLRTCPATQQSTSSSPHLLAAAAPRPGRRCSRSSALAAADSPASSRGTASLEGRRGARRRMPLTSVRPACGWGQHGGRARGAAGWGGPGMSSAAQHEGLRVLGQLCGNTRHATRPSRPCNAAACPCAPEGVAVRQVPCLLLRQPRQLRGCRGQVGSPVVVQAKGDTGGWRAGDTRAARRWVQRRSARCAVPARLPHPTPRRPAHSCGGRGVSGPTRATARSAARCAAVASRRSIAKLRACAGGEAGAAGCSALGAGTRRLGSGCSDRRPGIARAGRRRRRPRRAAHIQ